MSKTAATIETRGRSDVAQTETAVPPRDDVARRAYERFVERGGTHGADVDDWLAAEHELVMLRSRES